MSKRATFRAAVYVLPRRGDVILLARRFNTGFGDGYFSLIAGHVEQPEFVRACAEERQPLINVWEAVRYMAPGIVAHQSALRDGEVLPVPDWGDAPA